ncbi:hypothetical protein [Janthinobacterium agaricidamnosum]|uniref:Uncharacterized protein n=1 Tax=Janthinobacterium agaricidamnosum NBRC 102515 = DSM 9628 TaxID=1349767 RepID=W0VDA2_9BURK|nr:hypothetical protein [Janthinobacterium agaricidamnosum]CDG85358.1 putative uncharacterized protein [Janthinobacterium agaricidamnosum NBRC 102515 = DSM 9628]
MKRVGASSDGRLAAPLFDLGNPSLDWVALAKGMGVEAVRVDSTAGFDAAFSGAMCQRGLRLIEALID